MVTYAQPSGAFTPIWVAYEAGLFKKYGLNANLQLLTPQVSAQAVIAEEADFYTDGPDLINARLHGGQVKYFGGTMQQLVFQIWGAKEIKSIQELKGKSVAASTPRAALDTATREALKKNGLVPDKDVQILYVQIGAGDPEFDSRRQDRRRHAIGAQHHQSQRVRTQFARRRRQTQHPGVSSGLWRHGKVFKNNPNTVYAFLKAIAEGVVLSRKDTAVAKKAIAKYAKIDDAPTIDGTYDAFAPYWAMSLAVRPEAIRGQFEYIDEKEFPKVKSADPEGVLRQLFRRHPDQVRISEKSRHEIICAGTFRPIAVDCRTL